MKKYLPPLDLCCEKAVLRLNVHVNATVHWSTNCPLHGFRGLPSPLAQSKLNYEVVVADKIQPQERRFERKLWEGDTLS